MATETVTVNLGRGREVGVQATTEYLGLRGGSGSTELYAVTIRGITVDGEWDGDARHNTYVHRCPAELRRLLLPTYRAQAAAADRKADAEARAAEIRFYGRVVSRDL